MVRASFAIYSEVVGIHDREHVEISHVNELIAWLELNASASSGLWVVTHKKSSGKPAPSYDEIVRAVLCFGWIDSIPGKVDEHRSKLYVSPRKPNSAWSQPNKIRVEELVAKGEMRPAGLAVIEAAKASGSWTRIDSAQSGEIPPDLAAALTKHESSAENFAAFPAGVRKQILEWIAQAKTAPTREKRIAETAELAAQNIRANQWRRAHK